MLTINLVAPPERVAKDLLGCYLIREYEGVKLIGKIVEAEAYHPSDAASHSYKGVTPRTKVLFGPPGHAYVYFTYGMHYCVNVVTSRENEGSAVLIRAIEPVAGIEKMRQLRSGVKPGQLTNGPAKLCQALHIDLQLNGHNLLQSPLYLEDGDTIPKSDIAVSTRIGISKAKDVPWRFYIRNNPFVSHPTHNT